MVVKEERIGIEEARATLGDIVDAARIGGRTTTITRHAKPAARVIPVGVPYGLGDQPLDAERIRRLIQAELASVAATATLPRHNEWSPLRSHLTVGAERIWEIDPFRRLADNIGTGFDTDTDPMDDDDKAHVVATTQAAITRACIQLDAATWPTPTTRATDAARQLVEIAGLQRFIGILTGYYIQRATEEAQQQ
jgi:prevent-host-death family protein